VSSPGVVRVLTRSCSCPHQESFVGRRGHTVQLGSSFTESLVGKVKVAAAMMGFCCVVAENKVGEMREGWMEQSRLRSGIPPGHGSSREQAVFCTNHKCCRADFCKASSCCSLQGEMRSQMRGRASQRPGRDRLYSVRGGGRAVEKPGLGSGRSGEHRGAFFGCHRLLLLSAQDNVTTVSLPGWRTRRRRRAAGGPEAAPRGSVGTVQLSVGRRTGVAGALQERTRSICPEGSKAGGYYVLRH